MATVAGLGGRAAWAQQPPRDRQTVLAETLKPYVGPSLAGVDASTLFGKVLCGYQGWFKCTNDVPLGGQSQFVTYEGLPCDYYLRLTGLGRQLIRGEMPLTDRPPGAAW